MFQILRPEDGRYAIFLSIFQHISGGKYFFKKIANLFVFDFFLLYLDITYTLKLACK